MSNKGERVFPSGDTDRDYGLTKLEHFTAMAMGGSAAHTVDGEWGIGAIADYSVRLAVATLEALEKHNEIS